MVAIVRLEGYEKLVYMRRFSEKATGRHTGGNGNPNRYQVQRENPIFFIYAQQGFLSPDWHICFIISNNNPALVYDQRKSAPMLRKNDEHNAYCVAISYAHKNIYLSRYITDILHTK